MCRGFRAQPEVHASRGYSTSQALHRGSEGLTRVLARGNRYSAAHQEGMVDNCRHVREIGDYLSPRATCSKRRPMSWANR